MNDDQLLDAVLRREISIFTVGDERLRKLFILLTARIRNQGRR